MSTLPLGSSASAAVPVMVISGWPTAMVVPGAAWSSVTTPAKGIGTSTTALAVSTSATTWSTWTTSPALTCQVTISASSSPSPRSGSRKSGMVIPLQSRDSVENPVGVRQVKVFELRRWIGHIQPGDPQDRCLEVVETLLGQAGGDLGPVTGEARRLVHHHRTAGAAHRFHQGLVVERRQGTEVDDLNVPLLLDSGFGCFEGRGHPPAVGDEGDILARAADDGLVDGGAFRGQDRRLLGPVTPLGLEKYHGVGTADRLAQQAIGVGGGSRGDNAQACGVGVVGLRRV